MSQAKGGLRQYSAGVLKSLALDTTNDYYILHNTDDPLIIEIIQNNPSLKLIPKKIGKDRFYENILTKVFRGFDLLRYLSSNKNVHIPSYMNRICKKYNIDIIHCPYQFVPFTAKAKKICTIHDVQSLIFPENFSPKERMERAITYLDYIKRADQVVVSYQHIKNDLIKYYKIEPEKVQVVLMDMKKLWFEELLPTIDNHSSQIELPEKYILYPANTWPHKNHLNLIKALKTIKERSGVKINLICTGHQTEHFDIIKQFLLSEKMEKQVKFLGALEEKDLLYVYKNSYAVVIPTQYEAGSFPLMESILLNIPVICSNITSLPDTIKNEDLLFDPFSLESMVSKISELWQNDELIKMSLINNDIQANILRSINPLPHFLNLYSKL